MSVDIVLSGELYIDKANCQNNNRLFPALHPDWSSLASLLTRRGARRSQSETSEILGYWNNDCNKGNQNHLHMATALSLVQYSTFLLLTSEHNYDTDHHSSLPLHTGGESPGPAAPAGAHHGAGVVDDEVSRPAYHGYLVSSAVTENIYHQLCPQW